MTDRRKIQLLRTVLFSGLGVFACLLLLYYTDVSQRSIDRLGVWIYLFFVAIFNVQGWLLVRLSDWLNNQYRFVGQKRWRFVVSYGIVILLMFGVNYALLVIAKLFAGAEHPFTFPNGGLRVLILIWLVELVVLGLLLANNSMRETLRLQRLSASLQEETDAARYAALQNQLNPHFLFNSFNALISEIEYDPSRAVVFTRKLSDIYRYVLQSQQKRLVPLEDELRFAEAYLYLHEVRLGDCIRFEVEVAPDYDDALLPPLTLQLLLENVVKHNVVSMSHPMSIRLSADGGMLSVSNTLNPRIEDDSTGVGLGNLENRCRMTMGKGIEVRRTETLFIVKIPLCNE